MNLHLSFFIQLAGGLQLMTAVANFFLPRILRYRENLAKVSPIIREIFTIHALYIVLVLVGFGLICLLFPQELCGASPLGKFLCVFLAIFWGLRVPIQFLSYDKTVKKEHPWGALLFGTVFLYLALTFIAATFLGKRTTLKIGLASPCGSREWALLHSLRQLSGAYAAGLEAGSGATHAF
jgi:hypothetical protein